MVAGISPGVHTVLCQVNAGHQPARREGAAMPYMKDTLTTERDVLAHAEKVGRPHLQLAPDGGAWELSIYHDEVTVVLVIDHHFGKPDAGFTLTAMRHGERHVVVTRDEYDAWDQAAIEHDDTVPDDVIVIDGLEAAWGVPLNLDYEVMLRAWRTLRIFVSPAVASRES